jgi:hypothetical protein
MVYRVATPDEVREQARLCKCSPRLHAAAAATPDEVREQFRRNCPIQDHDVHYEVTTMPDGQKALTRFTTKRVTPAEGVKHGTSQKKEAP